MEVKVNDNCIGCGTCVGICQEVFDFNDEGLAQVIDNSKIEENKDNVIEASEACPVDAIEIK